MSSKQASFPLSSPPPPVIMSAPPNRQQQRQSLLNFARNSIGGQMGKDVKSTVRLPEHTDKADWLGLKVRQCYSDIKLLLGVLSDGVCTAETCPSMNAGTHFKYQWADEYECRTPIDVSGPEYCDRLMKWVDRQLNDNSIFPRPNEPYPSFFLTKTVPNIFKRLFRVYAHTYHSHRSAFRDANAEGHLNLCFKHFILVVIEFKLIDPKELQPLADIIKLYTQQQQEA